MSTLKCIFWVNLTAAFITGVQGSLYPLNCQRNNNNHNNRYFLCIVMNDLFLICNFLWPLCYLFKIWYMHYGSLILLMRKLRFREIQFLVQGPQARTEKGWVRAQSIWGKLSPSCSWAHRLPSGCGVSQKLQGHIHHFISLPEEESVYFSQPYPETSVTGKVWVILLFLLS